jgi:hypothetical protein
MSGAFNSEENIQSGRVECHDTIQEAILERGLAEELAPTVSNTTINGKKSYNIDDGYKKNNKDENESCSSSCSASRSCWKLTLAQANGKLWGGGAGGSVL